MGPTGNGKTSFVNLLPIAGKVPEKPSLDFIKQLESINDKNLENEYED